MSALLLSSDTPAALPAACSLPSNSVCEASGKAVTEVGAVPHHLTDEEREAAIYRASKLVEHYMAKWEETSDFQYRGDADRALRFMEILIAGRSDAQKARMERERGLA